MDSRGLNRVICTLRWCVTESSARRIGQTHDAFPESKLCASSALLGWNGDLGFDAGLKNIAHGLHHVGGTVVALLGHESIHEQADQQPTERRHRDDASARNVGQPGIDVVVAESVEELLDDANQRDEVERVRLKFLVI